MTMTTNQRPVSPGDPAEGDGEAWLLGRGGAGRGVAAHYVHKLGAPSYSHIALLTLFQVMALSSPHTEHSGVATHSGLVPTNLQTQDEILTVAIQRQTFKAGRNRNSPVDMSAMAH